MGVVALKLICGVIRRTTGELAAVVPEIEIEYFRSVRIRAADIEEVVATRHTGRDRHVHLIQSRQLRRQAGISDGGRRSVDIRGNRVGGCANYAGRAIGDSRGNRAQPSQENRDRVSPMRGWIRGADQRTILM